jgi:uncharacterized protein YndB with AHSA1/START domain
MELKTKITAEPGKQDMFVTRDFDLPVELLFRAYTEADILGEWMGTKVIKLENRKHGSWQIETSDPKGNVVFRANGVIHDFVANEKITRTFEMENTPFSAQLEFMEFEKLTEDTSRLKVQTLFRSSAQRDQMLQMGVPQGMNMAHNRLQQVAAKLK